jgi:glycolate dehydrogenase iron-sulfur subunit
VHTNLDPKLAESADAREAAAIVARCVHCGFCLATCPTYQVLGDERDSPRGRIYLIRELLEGRAASATTGTHLDRCLGCRACETTCPSGVRYGTLLDFGRATLEAQRARPWRERFLRGALLRVVPSRGLFRALLGFAQALRPLVPRRLAQAIPARVSAPTARSPRAEAPTSRRVLALDVCAESAAPSTRASLERVFARLGIAIERAPAAGCCGALAYHLGRRDEGLAAMRRNVDAWWPRVEAGVDAIVVSASGCGVMVRDYGHLLRDDPRYAQRAARIAAIARDPSEIIAECDPAWLAGLGRGRRVAFQAPCSLQHGLKGEACIERLLRQAGYELSPVADAHLCCGSAGSYSILQRALAQTLRTRKLAALIVGGPELIATANIGCQLHLGATSTVPVRHWIELLDAGAVASS